MQCCVSPLWRYYYYLLSSGSSSRLAGCIFDSGTTTYLFSLISFILFQPKVLTTSFFGGCVYSSNTFDSHHFQPGWPMMPCGIASLGSCVPVLSRRSRGVGGGGQYRSHSFLIALCTSSQPQILLWLACGRMLNESRLIKLSSQGGRLRPSSAHMGSAPRFGRVRLHFNA